MSKPKQRKVNIVTIQENKYFSSVLAAAFVLCVFFASSFKVTGDDDFFWHLATGQFILENHYVPDKDVFGHVTAGVDWIPFEWGWDVTSYALYQAGGYNAVMLFRTLILCAFFILYYRLLRKFSINSVLSIALLFLLLIGMTDRLSPRPHIMTYLFLVLLLSILMPFKYLNRDKYFKKLYFVPLIFLLWGNIHMGVVAGGLLLLVFVISEIVIYYYPRKFSSIEIKPLQKEHLKRLLIISIVSFIALFLNPHGFQTYLYAYGHTKLKMLETIGEWQNPFTGKIELNFIVTVYKILFFGGSIIIIYSTVKRDLTFALITIVFAVYSVRAIRFTVDYEIIVLFLFAVSINYFFVKFLVRKPVPEGSSVMKVLPVLLTLLFGYAAYMYYTGKVYDTVKYYRVSGWGIDEKYMPVQLFKFIKNNNIKGTPFNYFETGGYLVWDVPGEKNFIDSRNLNDLVFSEYSTILHLKQGYEKKLEQYGIDYIIYFNYELTMRPGDMKTQIPAFASRSKDWKLVYWDDKSMLFVKNVPKFGEVISKYQYKALNPFNYYFVNPEFQDIIRNDPAGARKEIERKSAEEPNGYFFYHMNQAAQSFLK